MSDTYVSKFRGLILASPPAEWAINQAYELTITVLRQGPVPSHVAFEMDGNRRWARSYGLETIEGHSLGFAALERGAEICWKCGVRVVTAYAFSIENFKRTKDEVDGLMWLLKVRLSNIAEEGELLDQYGASLRIIGNLDLIPAHVMEALDLAMQRTKNNKKFVLNVCISYTSRDETTTAIRSIVDEYLMSPGPDRTRVSKEITGPEEKGDPSSSTATISSQSQPVKGKEKNTTKEERKLLRRIH